MRLTVSAALLLATVGAVQADDLSAHRPMPRPVDLMPEVGPAIGVGVHPQPRPGVASAALLEPKLEPLPTRRPQPRPDVLAPLALAVQPTGQPALQPTTQPTAQPVVAAPKVAKPALKGAVCQRAEIKGKPLPPLQSRVKDCTVTDPVLVTQVAGVNLSPPATINCEEAAALSTWVTRGLQPAFKGQVVALNVADSSACRPRNNVPGHPVSVHGSGQAIDIAGFVTKSGQTYTVAQNYNAQIRAAQKAGCGIFHTILGPGSDGYHQSHIHFDVAHHGGQDYCH